MSTTTQFTSSNLSHATPELSEAATIWARQGNAALIQHLQQHAPHVCPQCGDPCGHLYRDETPEGQCLGCQIGWEDAAIADYERFEAETYGADAYAVCGCD